MINQYAEQVNVFDIIPGPVWLILGAVIVLAIRLFVRFVEKLEEERNRRGVSIIDLYAWTPHFVGLMNKIQEAYIPTQDGGLQKKVAIVVDTPYGARCIVSTHGSISDLVMDTPYHSSIYIFAKLIGYSHQGAVVHEEWAKEAFPRTSFKYGKLRPLPEDYILVKPSFNRGMLRASLSSSTMNLMNAFSFMNKYISKTEQEIDKIYAQFSRNIMDRLEFMNNLILSEYNSNLKLWDNTHKIRPAIMYVLSRTMHIDLSKLGYTALTHTLNQGSLEVAGEFISMLKAQSINLNDKFDQITVDKPTAQLLFNKMNKQKGQLAQASQQLAEYNRAKQMELDELNNRNQQAIDNQAVEMETNGSNDVNA